jgi:hypothetical protein
MPEWQIPFFLMHVIRLKTTGAYLSYLRLYLSLVDFGPIPIACHRLVANLTLLHFTTSFLVTWTFVIALQAILMAFRASPK